MIQRKSPRIGSGQLFGEYTIATEMQIPRSDMHKLIDSLVNQNVLPDLRDRGDQLHIVSEHDLQKVRDAWARRPVPPQPNQLPNDRHNQHRHFEEERIAQMFGIELGHLHALLLQLAADEKKPIRVLRYDKNKLKVQEEDMGIVQEAVLEHLAKVQQLKQPQGVRRPMNSATPVVPAPVSQTVEPDPWKHPKGRFVSHQEVIDAFGWSYIHMRNTVENNGFLPDRRREGDWYYWWWASDILHFLTEHKLRKADAGTLETFMKSLQQSINGTESISTATYPPLQNSANPVFEKAPEPPAPAAPDLEKKIEAVAPVPSTPAVSKADQLKATQMIQEGKLEVFALSSAGRPGTPAPEPVAEPVALTKIDPRALGNQQATDKMMQYMYQEAGVLDVPDLKKKIVTVSIDLKFDTPDLLIPLTLAHFGIDIQALAPVTMWTISAPTIDSPNELVLFQVALVNGQFYHVNVDQATAPATTPETEEETAPETDKETNP